ncbi:MAG: hypothetical protein GX626_06680 [Spirochaetales bacterium]|nr:hypothetical protein [Spirochaetales bacterium]
MRVLAIDPGPQQSGLCMINSKTYSPIHAEKISNEEVLDLLPSPDTLVVIEMVGHYGTGMPAGKEVFDTCVWIGRFLQHFTDCKLHVRQMMRRDVKLNLCGSARAKDGNVIQALVDRFASGQPNYGKGTKKAPGWFYGFKADVWQAYALGVTYIDKQGESTCITSSF